MKQNILSLLTGLLLGSTGFCQLITDQQYTTVNNNWGASIWYSFNNPWECAQSFTAGVTGDLIAIDWRTLTFTVCDSFELHIVDGPNPSGTELTAQVVSIGNNAPDAYYYIALNTPVAIAAGQPYTIVIDTVNQCPDDHPFAAGDSNGSYPGGTLFINGTPPRILMI